ncbi:SRPBCC family protein [Crocinitomicaceae bacterium]|nr:SRPBCC family protein [Crocinitomicaceae bacterium]
MEFFEHSGLYSLHTEQFLPITLDEAWHFFSTPQNLQKLTPGDLDFKITSPKMGGVYQGQMITYNIKIFPVFPTKWVTEITSVEDRKYFIDEQRFGPYKLWHHQHHFKEVKGGVIMNDIIHFKLPFSLLAPLAYKLFVKKKLREIFTFRMEVLDDLIAKNALT